MKLKNFIEGLLTLQPYYKDGRCVRATSSLPAWQVRTIPASLKSSIERMRGQND